jgi:transcriptional regulator with XRE-family HTH domain
MYSYKSTIKKNRYPYIGYLFQDMKDIATNFLRHIGNNIKKSRQEKKLSMQELGYKVGLSRMQVNRIEKGYNITLLTLFKFSLALNTSLSELLKFESKNKEEDLEWLVNNNKANKKR